MATFRKKPVLIEAVQFTRGMIEAHLFEDAPLPEGVTMARACYNKGQRRIDRADCYVVTAHEQKVYLEAGDWIVPELDMPGRYYPIKPSIFAATYEPVDEGHIG